MEKYEISVVIPLYNREDKICRALDSVFAQTSLDNIREIIVVDDGSSDNSVSVVREYSNKHNEIEIVIIEQDNQGPSSARNRGMKEARGNLIAFLDSDDMWLPNKIEKQIEVFARFDDAGLVGGNHENKPLKILFRTINELHKATLRELLLKSFPVTPSVIIKKEIFNIIGGFDETIRCYEDCDYFQTICAKGYGYYYLPEQIVCLDEKRQFGEKGLSSNLKMSHRDSIISLKKMHHNHYIKSPFYIFLRFFYLIKHWRRLLISRW